MPGTRPESPATVEKEIRVTEPACAVFRRTLKGEGLKYTPERARILDTVVRMPETFQADQLLAAVRASGLRVSKATVYRTIKLLLQSGVIQQVLLDAEHAHYQLAWGQGNDGLLVRTDTHEVERLAMPELEAISQRLCRERGLSRQGVRFVLYATGVPVRRSPSGLPR